MSSRTRRWLRRASWALMGLAVLLVGYVGTLVGYQSYQQHRLSSAWDSQHPAAGLVDATTGDQGAFIHERPHLADGQPLAKLLIPRIGFSAIVTEGIDSGFLSSGPGHDDHTGYPGEGRTILVGNHNGFSMSWGDLHEGDSVILEMGYGRYHYTIHKRSIFGGGDNAALNHVRSGETLLLVTCWPLWEGAFARERLVFEATPAGATA